jgi:glycosyltransferase involved in cell wall biosynthesis
MRILVLLTDAFGGRGGIAQHNRHLLDALCAAPGVEEVVALPRTVVEPPGLLPERLTYRTDAASGKAAYLRIAASVALRPSSFDLVVCGHLNLLPLAAPLAARYGARLVQVVHGIEAWQDPGTLKRALVRRADPLVSVSDFTRRRVIAWAGLPGARTAVIPNAVDLSSFGPGPKRPALLARYGLEGRRVILTLGRLSASERYKGHDEILDVLPVLAREAPDVAYLVVGDGDDRPRLEAKASALGLADRVVFAGYVAEADKADHYRLADVFAMPGRGEGFGIAYLEALACGVPVIASAADASREAVLDGRLGAVVDPSDPATLRRALLDALNGERGTLNDPRSTPEGLATFDVAAFRARWQALVQGTAPPTVASLPPPPSARPAALSHA